ncbi:MAG: hypothetical protein ABSC91_09670 [Candidatus Bathyarchaeia archaeon]
MVRKAVIALGTVCVILVVGLVGAIAHYTSITSGKDSIIGTKNTQIESLNSQISSLNSQVTNLKSQLSNLNDTVNDLNSVANLTKYTEWAGGETMPQQANSYTTWAIRGATYGGANYAGYIKVHVESNTTNAYVRVTYSSWYGVDYDNQIVVGTNGTAVFPALPAPNIEIRVGNTNLSDGVTIAVTIRYYY